MLTISEALNTVTRTIFLLTTDAKIHKLVSISKEAIEATPKCLKVVLKILAKCSNVMWNILEEESKQLAWSILMTKALQLQTKYIGTCRTRIMIYGALLVITKAYVGAFFALYGQVEEVACVLRNVGVPSK